MQKKKKKSTKPNDWSFERTNAFNTNNNNEKKKKKNAYGIFIRLSAFDWNSFLFSCLLTVARQWAAATHATLNSTKIFFVCVQLW